MKLTDKQIQAWAERYDIGRTLTELREMVEDAATLDASDRPSEAAPAAWLWIQNGRPVNAFLHKPNAELPYWKEKGFTTKPLYDHPAPDRSSHAVAQFKRDPFSTANQLIHEWNETPQDADEWGNRAVVALNYLASELHKEIVKNATASDHPANTGCDQEKI